jgi:GTP cyclohydrolase II
VPVRIHSECFTGDVLGSRRCDCGEQLDMAMQLIDEAGYGILIYLRQEGRGIGLLKKLQAYNLQDKGMDTVDANIHLGHLADEREYNIAALILENLQINSIKLITNNPKKIEGLKKLGIKVAGRIPIEVVAHQDNLSYLKTKAKKMAHMLFQPKNEQD